jgi:hypothetical protein
VVVQVPDRQQVLKALADLFAAVATTVVDHEDLVGKRSRLKTLERASEQRRPVERGD